MRVRNTDQSNPGITTTVRNNSEGLQRKQYERNQRNGSELKVADLTFCISH